VELGDELVLRQRHEENILRAKTLHPDIRSLHESNLNAIKEMLELTMQEYRKIREIQRKAK